MSLSSQNWRFVMLHSQQTLDSFVLNKGIIFDVHLEISPEDIQDFLQNATYQIARVSRVTCRRDDGQHVNTKTVIIRTRGALPEHFHVGLVPLKVKEYRQLTPIRCFNCQKFGHFARICRSKTACGSCGGPSPDINLCRLKLSLTHLEMRVMSRHSQGRGSSFPCVSA